MDRFLHMDSSGGEVHTLTVQEKARRTTCRYCMDWIMHTRFFPVEVHFFQILLFNVYCFQSFSTFPSIFLVEPILYVLMLQIMGSLCIASPILLCKLLFYDKKKAIVLRGFYTATLIPASCVLSYALFNFLTPYAAWSLKWLDYKDLIKATNGSPAFVYKYVNSPLSYTILPDYFKDTQRSDRDELRCHIASVYMTKTNEFRFFKTQYPDLYLEMIPKPALSSLTLLSTNVTGGDTTTGTINLEKSSSIDVVVDLSSFNESIATVPANITIPQGQVSGTFQIATKKQEVSNTVMLSATTKGQSVTINLTVNP